MQRTDLAIIGGGPAALQTAIYTVGGGVDTQVILKGKPGGQIVQTPRLENFGGAYTHLGGITGEEFIAHMLAACNALHVRFIHGAEGATAIRPYNNGTIVVANGREIFARAVVIAVGTTWFKPPAVAALSTKHHHIYYGPLHTQIVPKGHYAVLGSANSAAQGILELAQRGSKVSVLCRHELECEEFLKSRITRNKLIDVFDHVECKNVEMAKRPAGQYCLLLDPQGRIWSDGIFIMAGQVPNTEFLRGSGVELDEKGYIIHDRLHTTLPGVFVAGDCHNDIPRRSLGNVDGDANFVDFEVRRYLGYSTGTAVANTS